MDDGPRRDPEAIEVLPVVAIAQTFPARPSAIPEIRDFVRRFLAESPLSPGSARQVEQAVSQALLEAAGPTGTIEVAFRIFPEHTEVDVLRSAPTPAPGTGFRPERPASIRAAASPVPATFAAWIADVLRRDGLTHEMAARRLGVSVKTVSRWAGGETEPRLRDLRRIHDVFGEIPLP